MDKVKAVLQVLKKHLFWTLCVVITFGFMGTWLWTSARLQAETTAKQREITGKFSTAKDVNNYPEHPNANSRQEMDKRNESLRNEIYKAWAKQYEQQAAVLVWPQELLADFIEQVDSLRPIELTVTKEVVVDFRARYRDYIGKELPKLALRIGSRWLVEGAGVPLAGGPGGVLGGNPAAGGAGNQPQDLDLVVLWDQANQQELQGRFGWAKEPSTLEMLYAQEDLWVLDSLMSIVKGVNGNATQNYNASIKRVEYIRLGKDAVGLAGHVTFVAPPLDPAGGPGMPPGMPEGGIQGPLKMPGLPGAANSADPAEGRYVDENYDPLPTKRLRENLLTTDAKNAFLAVAKRMPVRIRLTMDQRKVHSLLAECANSSVPLEVRQIRVNRGTGIGGGGGEMRQPRGGMGGLGERPNPFGGMGGPGGPMPNRSGQSADTQFDIPVEIYGIVYIYNPASKKALGIPEKDSGVANSNPTPPPPAS